MTTHWYEPLRMLSSKGSTTTVVGGLSGLAAARQQHEGQFWTSDELAAFIWRLAQPAMQRALARANRAGGLIRLLDSSIGSGRLIQFADPAQHHISGCEVDQRCVAALTTTLAAAGFQHDIVHAGLDECSIGQHSIALLNPPFSLHFESPLLKRYTTNAFGRYGEHTSAVSHIYAIRQALDAADIVIAVAPASALAVIRTDPWMSKHVRAVYHLPGDAFTAEGADVATDVLVLAEGNAPCVERRVSDLSTDLGDLGLNCRTSREMWGQVAISHHSVSTEEPVITLPVTGDHRVHVYRRGGALKLHFTDGLTQARVMNTLLGERLKLTRADKHRYPKGIWASGQGVFDLEIHLAQPDPLASFQAFLNRIAAAGGKPEIATGLSEYIAKRAKRLKVERTAFRHWVNTEQGTLSPAAGASVTGAFTATVRKPHALSRDHWGSPRLRCGDAVEIRPTQTSEGLRYQYGSGKFVANISGAQLSELFDLPQTMASAGGWQLVHAGRAAAFPEIARHRVNNARRLGLDRWLSWQYQFDDLIELSVDKQGAAICGWMMALGKARLSASLCLLGQGRRNLIVVEAHLLQEFADELRTLGYDQARWQIIEGAEQTKALRTINVISYTRLRMPLHAGTKRTYAHALRNRIHTLVADEAHVVAHDSTQQVRALYTVSPKRRFGLTGTAIPNYPRDLLPLAIWAKGDGTAAQPFGRQRPYIEPRLIQSMEGSCRGTDVFRERHCTLEWVTSQWAEEMSDGAKREVPSLSGIEQYRGFASTVVLRRVWEEPEVAPFIKVPTPRRSIRDIDWDEGHLAQYLATAEEFADWWRNARKNAGADGKRINLVAVLARIGAVFQAANYPQGMSGHFRRYVGGLTSKQRAVIEEAFACAKAGRKTIVYATSPDLLSLLSSHLEQRGIETALYTGRISPNRRAKALDRFRTGKALVLLASFGVSQTGLNVPQASVELFLNRMWSPRQESQAEYRALRPAQKETVDIVRFHLAGSLDIYMGRMQEMKQDAARAGLDWGTPEFESGDFVHWVTVLDQFVQSVADLRQVERSKLRESLNAA